VELIVQPDAHDVVHEMVAQGEGTGVRRIDDCEIPRTKINVEIFELPSHVAISNRTLDPRACRLFMTAPPSSHQKR
jgi:hypothetical protein